MSKGSRRSFLRGAATAATGVAAMAAALSPLRELGEGDFDTVGSLLQKHYKEMTPEDMEAVLARIRKRVDARYGVEPTVRDLRAKEGVEYVYALNLSACIGCRKCVHACVDENNQSRDPQIQYIRVLEMPRGTIDPTRGNANYAEATASPDHYYMPIQCHQCADPPCVNACPVDATWQDADGITVIDYDWCIGCRYCEVACPYWARRFNYAQPRLHPKRINPDMGYLSNRPRPKGVTEKCTFCLHKVRDDKLPSCLEVCPTGARHFGNILDPKSEVSRILRDKKVFVLKAEAKAEPRFYYYFDEDDDRGPTA